jgi:hypothetical protein
MDHSYIDDNSIAERYLSHGLTPDERRAFEEHIVDCQECTDRLLLAEMFMLRNGAVRAPYPAPSIVERPAVEKPVVEVLAAEMLAEATPPAPISPQAPLPLRARVAARLTPWQLLILFVITALLLLSIPTVGILITERYTGGARSIDTRR